MLNLRPFLSHLPLLFMASSAVGQMPVPKVETAVMARDENPLDTIETFKGTLGLNLSQTALTNWAGGGESSVAFTALCNLSETESEVTAAQVGALTPHLASSANKVAGAKPMTD